MGGCAEGSQTCMQLIRAVACTRTQLTVLHLGVRPPVSKPTVFCPPSGRHRCRAFLGTCLLDGRVWRCASIDRTPQITAGMCGFACRSVRASVPVAERLAATRRAHDRVCDRAVGAWSRLRTFVLHLGVPTTGRHNRLSIRSAERLYTS